MTFPLVWAIAVSQDVVLRADQELLRLLEPLQLWGCRAQMDLFARVGRQAALDQLGAAARFQGVSPGFTVDTLWGTGRAFFVWDPNVGRGRLTGPEGPMPTDAMYPWLGIATAPPVGLELVGVKAIAANFDVVVSTANSWVSATTFPKPVTAPGTVRSWRLAEVEDWARQLWYRYPTLRPWAQRQGLPGAFGVHDRGLPFGTDPPIPPAPPT